MSSAWKDTGKLSEKSIWEDGGINEETLVTVMEAGANLVVAGSYVFNGDLADNVRKIEAQMEKIKSKLD